MGLRGRLGREEGVHHLIAVERTVVSRIHWHLLGLDFKPNWIFGDLATRGEQSHPFAGVLWSASKDIAPVCLEFSELVIVLGQDRRKLLVAASLGVLPLRRLRCTRLLQDGLGEVQGGPVAVSLAGGLFHDLNYI